MNDAKLLPHHRAMLEDESAISPDIIAARGYRSVERKADLKRMGFAESQCLVPTLLIPIFSATGEVALEHHRPDAPRTKNGKKVKYEFPRGARMAVDVHPILLHPVRDPNVPLFVTEGVKKADSAISHGLCCIALPGVWNWRGTNEFGGKTALPDWENIAFKDSKNKGRQVFICFDSDAMLKPEVYQALSRLSNFLKHRGAKVAFIYLPHGEQGKKMGLDDYISAQKGELK